MIIIRVLKLVFNDDFPSSSFFASIESGTEISYRGLPFFKGKLDADSLTEKSKVFFLGKPFREVLSLM